MQTIAITNSLLSSINNMFSGLFSSIDASIYLLLDKLIFIDAGIFIDSFISNFLGTPASFRTYINL